MRGIAQEIAALRKEAQAFTRVRMALRGQHNPNSSMNGNGDGENAAKIAFEKVSLCLSIFLLLGLKCSCAI